MPRDLFGDVTRPSVSIGNRKWYSLPVSLFSHAAIVIAIVAIPILAPGLMPEVLTSSLEIPVITIIPPTPPPIRQKIVKIQEQYDGPPIDAPTGIKPEAPIDLDTSFQDAGATGIVTGIENIDSVIVAPPPPPKVPEPVRVGGTIREPQKIRHVSPVYPAIAQAARVHGVVIIEATIGVDGRLLNARLLRSIPLLDQAALEAVRQWEFTPTLLNGVPVPVIMTVTVNFTLK